MHLETIVAGGEKVVTLKERLAPGLKAVLVGINPSPISVACGHYYQGKLGKRLWQRLRDAGMLHGKALPSLEDDLAFEQGFGMTDLVRRPTSKAAELSSKEKREAVAGLVKRLSSLPDRPLLLFVFKKPYDLARSELEACGFDCLRLPGPYSSRKQVEDEMVRLRRMLFEHSQDQQA